MAVPALLLAVDCEVYVYTCISRPLFDDLLVVKEIVLASGTVYDVDVAVAVTVVTAVVDYRTERALLSKTFFMVLLRHSLW